MTDIASKEPLSPQASDAIAGSRLDPASELGAGSSACTADSPASAGRAQGANETIGTGLLDELGGWWTLQSSLWSQVKALFFAESALAIKSFTQLVLGTWVLLIFLTLSIVLVEILVGMSALAMGLSPVGTILLLLAINVSIVIALYRFLSYLPKNLRFKHSCAGLKSSQGQGTETYPTTET